MLQQPMKEKLYALKLQGMAQALEHQEQDEAARELSFIDRLALLVDQQWNWRQNQALTRRVLAARLRREKRLLGDRRGSLPDALDDPDFAVASGPLARTDRRSHTGRRNPRPAGAQRASHRDARGLDT